MLNLSENNRHVLYIGFIFFFYYILLAIIALYPTYSLDAYWHLQMGKDFLDNGLSPWVDHYSFTFQGKEISTVPALFQIILHVFVSVFNENNGFYFFKIFYITLFMLVLYKYFRQIRASWFVVFLVLPFVVYLASLRLMIRPEVLSNVLMVICLVLYLRAQKSFATKELLFICLLLLFWVNYHSPIFGYIIVFGLFFEKAVNKIIHGDESFSWLKWFLWGVLIFVIGFMRHGGQHFLVTIFSVFTDDFGKYTLEYRPTYDVYSTNKVVYLSWVLSFYVAVWSLVKKQYGFAFIVMLLTYFSWSTSRLIASTSIVNFCILAYFLGQISWSRFQLYFSPLRRNVLLFISVSMSLLSSYYIVKFSIASFDMHKNEYSFHEKKYPVQVADYLKRYQNGGNILNFMGGGGYLINKLAPEFKVYFDGRTNILYPIEFVKHNIDMLNSPDVLKKEIENNDIQYAVYKNSPYRLLSFKDNDKLDLNFADENFLLFSENKEISFPLASKLMVLPMCWGEQLASGIKSEILLAEKIFSTDTYALKSILVFIKDYTSHESKKDFLDSLNLKKLPLDSSRRLAAYMALNSQNYKNSITLFSSIKRQNDYDFLMMAYSLIKEKNYSDAEGVLYYFYTFNKFVSKRKVAYDKIYIFSQLLDIIKQEAELNRFLPSYQSELEEKLAKVNYRSKLSVDYIVPYSGDCENIFNKKIF